MGKNGRTEGRNAVMLVRKRRYFSYIIIDTLAIICPKSRRDIEFSSSFLSMYVMGGVFREVCCGVVGSGPSSSRMSRDYAAVCAALRGEVLVLGCKC